jgi:FkbM family methyltransferase
MLKARYEHDVVVELVHALLGRGDELTDVGAATGAVVDAGVAAGSHVIAIEPNPTWTAELRERFARDRVDVVEVAVAPERATDTLFIPVMSDGEQNRWRASLRRDVNPGFSLQEIRVPTVPLDDLVQITTVLKIDVEGFELPVLLSGRALLTRCLPTIVIEIELRHHQEGGVQETFDLLAGFGYQGYFPAIDGHRRLEALAGFRFDEFQHIEDAKNPEGRRHSRRYVNNFVFIHPSKAADVAQRLHNRRWHLAL